MKKSLKVKRSISLATVLTFMVSFVFSIQFLPVMPAQAAAIAMTSGDDAFPDSTTDDPVTETFSDDFSDGNADDWVIKEGADNIWLVENEMYVCNDEAMSSKISVAGNPEWVDYNVSADIIASPVTNRATAETGVYPSLVFRCSDKDNFYMVMLAYAEDVFRLYRRVNGSFTVIDSQPLTLDVNTVYNVKAEVKGTSIKAYVDGTLLIDIVDDTHDRGRIGFRSYGSVQYFDNVSVTDATVEVTDPGPGDEYNPGLTYLVENYGTLTQGPSVTPQQIAANTSAIQTAIDTCGRAGGGTVIIPEGYYKVAPPDLTVPKASAIVIKYSNITLKGMGVDKTKIETRGEYSVINSAVVRGNGIIICGGATAAVENTDKHLDTQVESARLQQQEDLERLGGNAEQYGPEDLQVSEQIRKTCESLYAVPGEWSPDKKRIAAATTARTWIDTYIIDAETGKVSEPGVFQYIVEHAARYGFEIGENARPDPYVQLVEWSPDSKKVLLSYSFTDDLYTRQTGVAVFDLDKQAIDWMVKLLPFLGDHPSIDKPEGFRWDSMDYGWGTGLTSLDIENGEGVYNRKAMEEAVKRYADALNTSDAVKLKAFTDPGDQTGRFDNDAVETVLNDYEAYFRGLKIIRYEFAGISPYAGQMASYWLFNGDGRYKEVYFRWDSQNGYLSRDNFLYYSEYVSRLVTAFTEALAKEDTDEIASVLTEDDLVYPKEKVPDIINNFKTIFDLKTITCRFKGNTDGEAGQGAFIYLIRGEKNGLPVEHEIRVVYGDGLVALRDELIPSVQ